MLLAAAGGRFLIWRELWFWGEWFESGKSFSVFVRKHGNHMDPRHLFVDQRFIGMCVYCGGTPNTRDHVPSRVFLDEPLPSNIPVVDSCENCNNSFSIHEQYVACLLECAINGSAEPEGVGRDNVKRILTKNPSLRSRIEESCTKDDNGNLFWEIEEDRVRKVMLKLARGHVAFELGLPHLEEPDEFSFMPFVAMSDEQKIAFESASASTTSLWLEIGSRKFSRAAKSCPILYEDGWQTVQANRYRYFVDQAEGLAIQMVLSEYLACRVVWLAG